MKLPFTYKITDVLTRRNFEALESEFEDKIIAPALAGTWVNYDTSVFNGAGYYKVADRVFLRGLVKNGAAPPSTIFTLPVGYRPPLRCVYSVVANNAFGRVDIQSSGIVNLEVGSVLFVSLEGVSFRIA